MNETFVNMALSNNSMDIQGLQDIEPPFGEYLSGKYKKSFAYTTIKDRLPVILMGIIATMSGEKAEIAENFGAESSDELKQVIDNLSGLRDELMTNKPLTPLRLSNTKADRDATIWNNYLEERRQIEGSANLTWFNTVWLLSESYMYRRMNQELALTKTLTTYDPFNIQKQHGFTHSINSITLLVRYTIDLVNRAENFSTTERKHELVKLLKLDLWGNRCDLSLSVGLDSNAVGNPVELLSSFDEDLLIDDTQMIWNLLSKPNKTAKTIIVDMVLDNSGYELITDLCLASFLVAHGLAHKIRFYVKQIPWLISDVNLHDFHWTVDHLRNASDPSLKALGNICAEHLKNNVWTIEVESFWTEPYDFGKMKEKSSTLYEKLGQALLVIFKGDLNYRKLMGDFNWEHTKTLEAVLREYNFQPTSIATVRTIKADLCVGLTPGKAEELSQKKKNWMITGEYGLINAWIDTPKL